MTVEPPRSSAQLAGTAAIGVVEGLKAQPALLAVVVLNALAIGVGVWFMTHVIEASQKNMQTILSACLDGHRPDRAP